MWRWHHGDCPIWGGILNKTTVWGLTKGIARSIFPELFSARMRVYSMKRRLRKPERSTWTLTCPSLILNALTIGTLWRVNSLRLQVKIARHAFKCIFWWLYCGVEGRVLCFHGITLKRLKIRFVSIIFVISRSNNWWLPVVWQFLYGEVGFISSFD